MIRRIKNMIGKSRILPARIRSEEEVEHQRTEAQTAHKEGLRARDTAMAEFRKIESRLGGVR